MKGLFAAGLLLAVFAACATAAGLSELTLISEEYPPFNFTEDGIRRGIATDALMEMLAAAGSLRSSKDIASLPWARGYRIALEHPNVLLFSVTRTAAREKKFKWVGPIVEAEIVLLQKNPPQPLITNLHQVKERNLRIGVVLDDVGHQLLKENQVPSRQIVPLNKGRYLAKMLKEDRIDLAAYDKLVTLWNLKELGERPDTYLPVFTLKKSGYYFALSLGTSDQLVEILQQELDRLKSTGRLDAIIKSYLQ
jgi:ABC-type amino acid transport substrate-binding protein